MGSPRLSSPRRRDLILRPAARSDASACARLLYDAVHQGATHHYSAEERRAWAPGPEPAEDWADRLTAGHATVAQAGGKIVGFSTLGTDGHLDYLYVTPSWMGRGAADALHEELIEFAELNHMQVLSTDASHLARSFLSRKGWHTLARQSVIRRGVAITNFRMELLLPEPN